MTRHAQPSQAVLTGNRATSMIAGCLRPNSRGAAVDRGAVRIPRFVPGPIIEEQ